MCRRARQRHPLSLAIGFAYIVVKESSLNACIYHVYIVVSTCECGSVNVCHAFRCAARKLSAPDYVCVYCHSLFKACLYSYINYI